MSSSKRNYISFSRVVGKRFDLSARPAKTAEIQKRQREFPLTHFYLKERELDEEQPVSSKATLRSSSVLVPEGNCAKQIQ